ncbi:MAG: alpha/beta fold hydrolase [Burkholderiaceae bacterium]
MAANDLWLDVHAPQGAVRVHAQWVSPLGVPAQAGPPWVLLHEGLGSVSAWRDFPQQLCRATQARALVFSRPGYGRSTPRPPAQHWGHDFMHVQAQQVVPAVLHAAGLSGQAVRLYGHSDGGSIALLMAAHQTWPLAGVVVEAPHIMVETVSLQGIRAARQAYEQGELKARLARHHDNPDSAFWGWNHAWLDPGFESWSIEHALTDIAVPVLALQGLADPYGTRAQVDGIVQRVAGAQVRCFDQAGHSLHRSHTDELLQAVAAWLGGGLV